ncbi:MAG: cytochrome c maturation protein CcmE, partial [Acidobacteria bacterium]|nr:cytochrome c maturation protein CcmE [Acidobacteriota bacterium]
MPDKAVKILLTTGILCAAFVGLLWTTMQDGTQYYLEVEEVMAEPATWDGKPLQVHGYAANVMRRPKTLDYRFEIADSVDGRTHVLNAVYTGIVPDTFDNHAEVVATGRLDGDTFHIDADGIMAKCPSKY